MHFATPPSWWLAALIAAGILGATFFSYRRPVAPISTRQRTVLAALRLLALTCLALFLCRPVVLLPPAVSGDTVIPVLVDMSRSMRVGDADGETRMARASAILRDQLLPALSRQGRVDVFSAGERLSPATPDVLSADARRTDLSGAIAAVNARYRGRRVPGIVILSDGGDTGDSRDRGEVRHGIPVFAIGIGSPEGLPDREVIGLSAGDPRLDQAAIDLHVSVLSRGYGRAPFQLRILANGRLIDSRSVVPAADASPLDEMFTVSPDPLNATIYTAEVAAGPDEAVQENNSRGILVSPAGRKRRVLLLAGAPGYELSFMIRALEQDPGLEVDSIVRKGRNEDAKDTFLVQAGGNRGPDLTSGFPSTRQALYKYDALVISNVEGDFFTRDQLASVAAFVGERGAGVVLLGGHSFTGRGLMGSPLEDVLPLELTDRRGGAAPVWSGDEAATPGSRVVLTQEGRSHPIMRLNRSADESQRAWSALPGLTFNAPLGGPRPGALVLAVTASPSGAMLPVVAVQRFGRGRSMIFAGEASWRWRMMQPSTDRSYEFFWRQALRWLSSDAPDPITLTVPASPEPGDSSTVDVDVRDASYAPVADARVEATVTMPGGETKPLAVRPVGGGRFAAAFVPDQSGAYRVRADARRATESLGSADRWFFVGGDREFADPRLNEGFLRRLAADSGGRYVRAADAAEVATDLRSVVPQKAELERRDLWHEPWAYATIVLLLSAEWILRRRWGLK